ncbi:GTA-gp10 family protein [Sphingomonas sp. KRR8]|uniref:GTA-gp10 family protein n=1 Tax=Sphingomonas sp. KRR8 TaxID=2942996 RepID=UPI002021FEEC|nr:GTA-gp10 family protein [Sphingomonas sp. KRR8]URD62210.1 GTA-gp10 family protein [Sphingomonas sp. KRR8]
MIRVAGHDVLIRSTFSALVAAEEELGSLINLIDRAGKSELKLAEIATLFDHLSTDRQPEISRDAIGRSMVVMGLSKVTPMLRTIFSQILQGAAD